MSVDELPTDRDSGVIVEGRYEVLSILGEGGYGIVYRARQISTSQNVAIKLLHTDLLNDEHLAEECAARFEREMSVIAQLKHPNIVRLIDCGQLETGQLYMVLEYIEGVTLLEHLEQNGPLDLEESLRVMSQVLDALHAAHKLGIVHRDLKPHNIMLTSTGYRTNATVLDFGIAGVVEGARGHDYRTLTKTSGIRGTPSYMAPEQLRAKILTPQSDLYSWGLCFVECLTAAPAVDGASPFDVALEQVSDEKVRIPDELLPFEVYDVIRKAVAKPLDERYETASEVFDDLAACQAAVLPSTIVRLDFDDQPSERDDTTLPSRDTDPIPGGPPLCEEAGDTLTGAPEEVEVDAAARPLASKETARGIETEPGHPQEPASAPGGETTPSTEPRLFVGTMPSEGAMEATILRLPQAKRLAPKPVLKPRKRSRQRALLALWALVFWAIGMAVSRFLV